jgi:HK97 family phage major capsid protein
MEYEKELRGILKELLQEREEAQKEGLNGLGEKLGAVGTMVDEIDKRLKTIEASGPRKVQIITPETERKEWRHEFAKWFVRMHKACRGGDRTGLIPDRDTEAKAAMQEDTTTEGGYLVPTELQPGLVQIAAEKSFMLQKARVIPMAAKVRTVPTLATASKPSTHTWTAEEGSNSSVESEPTLGATTLTAKKWIIWGKISTELVEDADLDVVGLVADLFGEALGCEIDYQSYNGTGSPVSGILLTTGNSVVMATGSTAFSCITATHLSEMISQIVNGALEGCWFALHRTVLHYVRTLKDSNGNFIWAPPAAAQPGTIWGFPYVSSEQMPSTSGASTACVWFGNPQYWLIGDRRKVGVDTNPYLYWANDQNAVRLRARYAFGMGLAEAFSKLVTAAS